MKKKITEQPVLKLPNFKHPFQVKCDASGVAIGVVISQEDRPITYFSEKLNDTKQKYSSYDNEFYAIIQAMKHWRHYLMPGEFVLYSSNHTLQYIMQQPKLNLVHVKWIEFLQSFTFVSKHISGQSNKVADALSRRLLIMQENQIQVLGFEQLRDLYEADIDFQEVYRACKNLVEVEREPWMEYALQYGLLFINSKVCIPKCSMRDNLIQEKHNGGMAGHFGSDKTFGTLRSFLFLAKDEV